jgi:FkbM family methyltransferase
MAVPHDSIGRKFGHLVTRTMMWEPLRRTALGRRAYAHMYLFGKRFSERRERQLLRRHLQPGMTIVDIGANVGFYTVEFSRLAGPGGAVHAFEPDPFCSGILRSRVRSRRARNVHVVGMALGETEGEATLYCSKRDRAESRIYPLSPGVPAETVNVATLSLDSYCRSHGIGRVDVVKMDVEGCEVRVLRGMREIMATCPPTWMLIEFSPEQLRGAGASPEEFWRLLASDGYDCYSIEKQGRLRKISDSPAFTEAHAHDDANIWAAHRAPSQPGRG